MQLCVTRQLRGGLRGRLAALTAGALLCLLAVGAARAGPPFLTDDPEPVEYRHWEFYVASQYMRDSDGRSGTTPHFEINYGVASEVQLHLIVPFAWNQPSGDSLRYGLGDLELGVKYRFITETDRRPQVGVFPLVEVPTGNSARGLGGGRVMAYLPVWLQKSWGDWTTYGGGGYWLNPGPDHQNFWFTGWLLQRRLSDWLTLGGEVFHLTADTPDGGGRYGFNLGGIVDFSPKHHLLFSAGRDFSGGNNLTAYLAYQFTFGPSP